MHDTVGGGTLRRSPNRIIAGVCAGLAEYFRIEPLLVRVGFVVFTIIPGLGLFSIILYLVLWVLMPPADSSSPSSVRSNLQAMGTDLRRLWDDTLGALWRSEPAAPSSAPPSGSPTTPPPDVHRWGSGPRPPAFWAGAVLIALGIFFLLNNLGLLSWWNWDIFWPLLLIALGVWILARRLGFRV